MFLRRLKYWKESARRSEALREEMELHIAEAAAQLQSDGMTAEGARAEARRRFGNVGLKQEASREVWILRFWSELGQDATMACAPWPSTRPSARSRFCHSLSASEPTPRSIASWIRCCCARCRSRTRIAGHTELARRPGTARFRDARDERQHLRRCPIGNDSRNFPVSGVRTAPEQSDAVFSSVFAYYPTRKRERDGQRARPNRPAASSSPAIIFLASLSHPLRAA